MTTKHADHLDAVAAAMKGTAEALDAAVRAFAADHAGAFTALDAWGRAALASRFRDTMLRAIGRGLDEVDAYSDAYFSTYEGAVATLRPCLTGGADWSVDEAFAIHATDDMEGLFLLRDDEYGCWSVVHRMHDEDGNAEIVPLVEDDDWPTVVNAALRMHATHTAACQ